MDTNIQKKKIDRRILKTKRAICNAFVEILSEKTINEITIKEIADTADVNRKTVYNYYSGIHEILDEIENDLVNTFVSLIKDCDFSDGIINPSGIFESLNEVITSNMEFYSYLLKTKTLSQLLLKIVPPLKNRLKEVFIEQKILVEDKLDLIVSYIVPGMVAAYQYWFNSGKKQPLEEFSKDVSTLLFSGVRGFRKN